MSFDRRKQFQENLEKKKQITEILNFITANVKKFNPEMQAYLVKLAQLVSAHGAIKREDDRLGETYAEGIYFTNPSIPVRLPLPKGTSKEIEEDLTAAVNQIYDLRDVLKLQKNPQTREPINLAQIRPATDAVDALRDRANIGGKHLKRDNPGDEIEFGLFPQTNKNANNNDNNNDNNNYEEPIPKNPTNKPN